MMSFHNKRGEPDAPVRRCAQCGSDGPFYKNRRKDTCTRCLLDAEKEARRVAFAQQDLTTLTRRRQLILLRLECPPHKKVCAYCFCQRRKSMYGREKRNKDGLKSYCVLCCRMNDHFYRYKAANERYV
jgi:hypothetical protein